MHLYDEKCGMTLHKSTTSVAGFQLAAPFMSFHPAFALHDIGQPLHVAEDNSVLQS